MVRVVKCRSSHRGSNQITTPLRVSGCSRLPPTREARARVRKGKRISSVPYPANWRRLIGCMSNYCSVCRGVRALGTAVLSTIMKHASRELTYLIKYQHFHYLLFNWRCVGFIYIFDCFSSWCWTKVGYLVNLDGCCSYKYAVRKI